MAAEDEGMKRVVSICYDSDVTTNQRVQAAERRLTAAVVKTWGAAVRVVRIPAAKNGGKQGMDDFLKVEGKPAFNRLLRAAQPVETAIGGPIKPVLLSLGDVQDEEVDWLWEGRIACRTMNAIVGDPGQGKSTLALEIVAKGSRGLQPFTNAKCEPFATLYLSNENHHPVTTKPRFIAAGGDVGKFTILDKVRNADSTERLLKIDDVDAIETAIRQTGTKLLILDPIQSYIGGKVDNHAANQVRDKLDPLGEVAKRNGVAIVLIAHLAKTTKTRAVNSILGSVDYGALVRNTLLVGSPPEAPDSRVVIHIKHSYGKATDSLGFVINSKGKTSAITWQKGKSSYKAEDLFALPDRRTKQQTQVDNAVKWLQDRLADGKPYKAKELQEEWEEETGINARKLREAALRLGVDRKHEGGKDGPRIWMLSTRKFEAGYKPGSHPGQAPVESVKGKRPPVRGPKKGLG
jgi:KaiC/GvpD/RAD55 family RecA-like ATPase